MHHLPSKQSGVRSTRWWALALAGLTLICFWVGFVLLPSAQSGVGSSAIWDRVCRAAGVPGSWSPPDASLQKPMVVATDVMLDRQMTAPAPNASAGRGATLALNCTMCHGPKGVSRSEVPHLAGQYPEVLIKQLRDYQSGKRRSAVMEAIANHLSDQDVQDLAAYYMSLSKTRTAVPVDDRASPTLIRVGSPLRNIAPCFACHGGSDQKLGAPWIEGMPKTYLVDQLKAFRGGQRHNDAFAVMRDMARGMTDAEIEAVSAFYAAQSR